ncbi:MAG: dihydroneopterin aldolase [bacterium]
MEDLSRLDRITIHGINVLGHHGVEEAERKVGHRLVIDVDLYLDLSPAARDDDIKETVNYEAVCNLVEKVTAEEEFLLIESLASEIAAKVLERFSPDAVTVKVKKFNLPIATGVGSVGVEVTRYLRK